MDFYFSYNSEQQKKAGIKNYIAKHLQTVIMIFTFEFNVPHVFHNQCAIKDLKNTIRKHCNLIHEKYYFENLFEFVYIFLKKIYVKYVFRLC